MTTIYVVLQAVQLLVKTKINLNAKNLENSTALDMGSSAEMKGILLSVGAKPSSKVKDAPTLAQKLRSNGTFMDTILIHILRVRRDLSEEQRNAFLIVATLIATAIYQSSLSPPRGVYGDNDANMNTTSSKKNVGKSVMSEGDFFTLSILNSLSLLLSIMTIYILTPINGLVGWLLVTPIFWFAFCYVYNMKLISPTSATSTFNLIMLNVYNFLYSMLYWAFYNGYKKVNGDAKNREIKIRNSLGGNKW